MSMPATQMARITLDLDNHVGRARESVRAQVMRLLTPHQMAEQLADLAVGAVLPQVSTASAALTPDQLGLLRSMVMREIRKRRASGDRMSQRWGRAYTGTDYRRAQELENLLVLLGGDPAAVTAPGGGGAGSRPPGG